ncbi:MAG: HAD-IA family hydrolase [Yoonia sp.]|nr:HAD-IA family hydrolase [Yoonia sp.]
MPDLRLVIFDVDGTLVDSQAEIMAAMTQAFASEGVPMLDRPTVLSIVGLSLAEAFAVLCPNAELGQRTRLVQAYKDAFNDLRGADGNAELSPMFDGALAALQTLQAQDDTLLAVATGKSKRGLDKMIERHGLEGLFVSQQVADFHPSKPHPAMVLAALSETGVDAKRAVMLGDTTYDMDMGRAAGVGTIGVSWGYHEAISLNADIVIDSFAALPVAINKLTGHN